MFWKKKNAPQAPPKDKGPALAVPTEQTVIDDSYTLRGRIHGQGVVEVKGRMEGRLDIQGQVSIAASAVVQGEIKAEVLEIGGQVEGHLDVSRKLILGSTAQFEGSAAAGSIAMAEGASLNGDVHMKS